MPLSAGDEDAAVPGPSSVGEPREPEAGMEFASPEEARAFYCAYAARAGFRVRSSKSFASRIDDAIIMRRFVCTRQGLPSRKDTLLDASKKRRNRASARAACPAMLQVNRRPSSRWLVSRCTYNDHVHEHAAVTIQLSTNLFNLLQEPHFLHQLPPPSTKKTALN
uniref:FAR1 domain-containing protein n=1 Tax=Oryza punctata TaxID=4537 RepID=A0A0E0ME92_ORYPU